LVILLLLCLHRFLIRGSLIYYLNNYNYRLVLEKNITSLRMKKAALLSLISLYAKVAMSANVDYET